MSKSEKMLVSKSTVNVLKDQAIGCSESEDAYERGMGAGIRLALNTLELMKEAKS